MFNLILGALKRTVLCMVAFCIFVVLMPGLPPYDVEFTGLPHAPVIPFEGGLSPNHRMESAELLSSRVDHSSIGYLKGAESFTVHDGYLYSGVQGGDIIRLNIQDPRQSWEFVTKIGGYCVDLHEEKKCGRPLGLTFDLQGRLLVCDAYYGLYRFNLKTGQKQVLVPSSLKIDGKRNTMTNSLAMSKDGKSVYFTSSSTNFVLSDGLYEMLSAPSGRVMKYDVNSNTTKVLMEDLSFANGIALSPQEDFLLVCETGAKKVWRYWLLGDRRGQKEVFASLPGAVDNIMPSEDGKYIVGVIVPTLPGKFYFFEYLTGRAWVCKLLVRLSVLVQTALEAFNNHVYYLEAFAVMTHHLGNTEHAGANMVPKYGLLVELDPQGKVVQSWQSSDPMISKICEGFLHQGYLYLGSPYNTYVARLNYHQ